MLLNNHQYNCNITKSFLSAIGPFLSSKFKSRRLIILKEDNHIITDTSEICNIFIKFFSTIASSICSDDQIAMADKDYFAKTLAKHLNHISVLATENHHTITTYLGLKW